MKLEIEVPAEKVELHVEAQTTCDMRCTENCQYLQDQLFAMAMGWT